MAVGCNAEEIEAPCSHMLARAPCVQHGVTIVGHANVPSRVAQDASTLFAKNLLNFMTPLVDGETQKLNIDWEDEIIQGTLVCRDGSVVHPALTGQES